MQTLADLEIRAAQQPNSIELTHALAERYFAQGRWEQAARAFRTLADLHTSTASLFIHRIRLGAVALMLSSVMMLLAFYLQPALEVRDLSLFREFTSSEYLASQALLVVALALYSTSAISVYKLLSYTRDHRPAFWAMVLSVIGAGLSMPALGIKLFVHPLIGKLYLAGNAELLALYSLLNEQPLKAILNIGNYLIIAGIVIFARVVWRNRGLSLRSLLLFLAGWLGLATLPNLAPPAFGALVALGGLGFGFSLWKQASTQFEAGMDRSNA
jgi:hypothetical protein